MRIANRWIAIYHVCEVVCRTTDDCTVDGSRYRHIQFRAGIYRVVPEPIYTTSGSGPRFQDVLLCLGAPVPSKTGPGPRGLIDISWGAQGCLSIGLCGRDKMFHPPRLHNLQSLQGIIPRGTRLQVHFPQDWTSVRFPLPDNMQRQCGENSRPLVWGRCGLANRGRRYIPVCRNNCHVNSKTALNLEPLGLHCSGFLAHFNTFWHEKTLNLEIMC